jgi:phage tail-like protein
MPALGSPRSFYNKFKFLVEIDGITYAGFSKCSELSVEAAKIEHHEGASLIPDKSPGRLTFADITLERGATDDLELYDWFEEVADASAGIGGAGRIEPLFKRTLDIVQLDRNDAVLQRWTLTNAWPTKFVAGEWDNGSDEKVITMVTLAYDFFKPQIRRAR